MVAEALTVRLGLHTGAVVVGGIGDDSELAATLVGDTALLAAAFQDMAAPGTILCSEAVARLAQDIVRCEAVPPRSGQPALMTAYKVLSPRPRRMNRGHREGQPISPLVGRALELATLQTLLEQVHEGQGHVVGIVGEPGIGKSRLLAEFRHSLEARQVTYLAGRCVSYNSMTPYGLVADLLRHNCGVTDSDPPDMLMARVHHSLQEVDIDPDTAPYLLHLLGVAVGAEQFVGLSAEAVKARTFDILLQMSLKGSQRRPLIVEVEDLHWSDATSEEYLAAFVERLAGMPILVLATYRPGYHPAWIEKSYVTQLALRRLSPTQGQEMMQALLQDTQLPVPLVQEIVVKADGNPFFLEELAQTVRESGASALATTVPDTIQAVLAARIDRLPPTEKRLLQVAAVIGKDVTFPLLQAVTALSDVSLQQHLTYLQAAEFLYERPVFPAPLYTFKHALTQEVAYQSLLSNTRQQYHRQIAQVLTERFAETVEPQPELLAHHYTEAGFHELAITSWYRAGVRASARSACVEAIAHLTRGLAVLQALPASSERLQHELDFQTTLAPALMAIRSPVALEVEQAYARAHTLCQQVGPNPKLVWALEGLWAFHLVRGEFQTAQELGQQLLRLAQHLQTPLAFVVAHQALGLIAFYRGEFGSALEHFQQGAATYDPQHSRVRAVRGVNDPGVMCAAFAALALCVLGYPDQGLQHSQAMLRLAHEVAHPHSLAFARCAAAVAHQCRREGPATLEQAEAAVLLAREQGFPLWAAMGEVLGGWALAIQGQGKDGVARIRRGLAVWRATGAANVQPYFFTLLADACRMEGQVEAGLQALADALTVANTTGERWWAAETYRLRGEFLQAHACHGWWETEAALRQALTLAQQQGGKLWELRAAVSLSRLLASQGQGDEARRVLRAVYAWFSEGSDTADLQEARAQLEALA
jgi:predicted ATPase